MLVSFSPARGQRKTVGVTAHGGGRTINATFEYGTSGLELEEVEHFDEGDPIDTQHDVDSNTKIIRLKGLASPGDEFMMGISIVEINGTTEQYKEHSHNGTTTHIYCSTQPRLKKYEGTLEWNEDLPLYYGKLPISWSPVKIDEDDAKQSGGTIYYYMYAAAYDFENNNLKASVKVIVQLSLDGGEKHVEVDNVAGGYEGVWDYAIPASVIIAILGYTLTKGKRKEGKEEGEEDPKHPDKREMLIYKDFGDTFLAGEDPKQVFAKIVRKTKTGDVTDMALTEMIQIKAGDEYMQVSDSEMQGDWKSAWVTAPDTENPPEEGIVTFFMGNDNGSYTNRLHFKVEAGKVLFGQDNLTLPAHYDKEVRLPFVVVGMDGSKEVDAHILNVGTEKPTDFYSVRVEWNEKKEVHEAIITDLKRDPKTDNGTPGDYIPFTLKVEAKHPGGRTIEGQIALVRYYMGLVLKVGDLKCYTEEYDKSKHQKLLVGVKRGDKTFVPAETIGRLLLYDYDEGAHKIVIINPIPTEKGFFIKAVNETEDNQVQGIGIQCDVVSNKDPKGTECVFRCVQGVLDPPSRIDAVIHIETELEGKTYAYDKQVLLCSQPWRTFQTDAEWSEARKADNETIEKLNKLIDRIERQGLAGRLLPIIKYIDNMLWGYDFNYGFDRDQLHFVGVMYNHMLTERQEYTFNESTAITLGDEMLMFAGAFIETNIRPVVNLTNKFNEKLGVPLLIARIGVGFWTYGASEAYFRAYDALCIGVTAFNLAEIYVNEGKDGLTKSLVVMAKDTAKFQILMTGVQIGLRLGFSGLRAKYNPRTPNVSTPVRPTDIKPKTEPVPSGKQFSSAKKGRITQQAISESNQRQAKAVKDVTSSEAKAKIKGMKPKRDLTEALEYNEAKANQDLQDLRAVVELCEENPTPENLALKRKIIIDVQYNKRAMHIMKHLGSEFTETRRQFNLEWYGINNKVDKAVIQDLAEKYHVSPKEIKVGNVSTSKMTDLLTGETATMDRDTHYYTLDAKGEKVYFDQQFTEQSYYRHLHEETLGYEAISQEAANKFGRKVDHTVIEDVVHHPESLGPKENLEVLMNSKRHCESLADPNKASDAIIWKSEERFRTAEEKLQLADTMTNHMEKVKLQSDAINDLLEGNYMTAKDADNFVIPMDEARADVNGGLFVSDKLRHAVEHCRLVDTDNPIDVMELELRIKSEGYNSFNDLATDLGETFRRVSSPKLGVPSTPSPTVVNLNA